MASQVTNGKAFEWAMGLALTDAGLLLTKDSNANQNESCFAAVSPAQQRLYTQNAHLAAQHILSKEKIDSGHFSFLADHRGQSGDVRDIVIVCDDREIGISCKTNHAAYKHSRLSDKVNFVEKWDLDKAGCSAEYMQEYVC